MEFYFFNYLMNQALVLKMNQILKRTNILVILSILINLFEVNSYALPGKFDIEFTNVTQLNKNKNLNF